jgi:hypothetical protein
VTQRDASKGSSAAGEAAPRRGRRVAATGTGVAAATGIALALVAAAAPSPAPAASANQAVSTASASSASSASSSDRTEPRLAPAIANELSGARLAGEGALRWFGLKVYTARLWVTGEGLPRERLDAAPFALQLHYSVALRGDAIADRSLQEIERLGHGDASSRERWHAAMRRLFPDVDRDERLTGVNRPGRGVAFFHEERPLGSIDDEGFASAFFAIWLDERTSAPALRRSLLQRIGGG